MEKQRTQKEVTGVATFYAVHDRQRQDRYALIALSDHNQPGFTRAYRWVPNWRKWVADRGLLADFHTSPIDQMNQFEHIEPAQAARLARELPPIAARWVLDAYKRETERLTSTQVGLPADDQQPRPVTDPQMVEAVRNAPLGTWVQVRRFPADRPTAARTWASEVRRGKKARLAPLGPLEARVETADGGYVVKVRRSTTSAAIVETARRIATDAHVGQVDKAGRPYIDHPRRVAERLEATGAPAEAVAAGWLHDVVEDTEITTDDLLAAGVPPETVAAVEAVTKRKGEPTEEYAARIRRTPLAVTVKRADLADNSDPNRLALLDDEGTRTRLTAKYDRMKALLGSEDTSRTAGLA